MWWVLLWAVAVGCIGAAFLLAPGTVREKLMPDWRRYRGAFVGTSLLSFRVAGLAFVVMGVVGAPAFFFGAK